MTKGAFDRVPWWEFDPEEKPVPVAAGGWGPADEAELIANAERQAIIREDTEPALVTLSQLAAVQEPARSPSGVSVTRRAVVAAALTLLVGCAGTFSLGWRHGRSAVRADATSMTRTTPSHSHTDSLTGSDLRERTGEKGDRR
ncbi:MAG: hypothetical protein M3N53_13370 [Actinomycetota bacterium]|nr:hypothetical protein [Actinomycetota bacterium]